MPSNVHKQYKHYLANVNMFLSYVTNKNAKKRESEKKQQKKKKKKNPSYFTFYCIQNTIKCVCHYLTT